MWVADMNFKAPSYIPDAMVDRIKYPFFCYAAPRDEHSDTIINWQQNGVKGLTHEVIGYEGGVLGGVMSASAAFTAAGDAVLVHSLAYIGFTGCLKRVGCRITHLPLVRDSEGVWWMDCEDMDRKLEEYKIHLMIFCSPQNPAERVWTTEELEKAGEVFAKHHCIVLSDEIWSDLIMPGYRHISYQSINEDAKMRCIALYSSSKPFSLVGLVGSRHTIYNPYPRDRIESVAEGTRYNKMDILSRYALMGAYSGKGAEWIKGLVSVLSENVDMAGQYLRPYHIHVARPESICLLFLDCSGYLKEHGITINKLIRAGWDVSVIWQDRRLLHPGNTIRMSLASPTARVEEAFSWLDKYVFTD